MKAIKFIATILFAFNFLNLDMIHAQLSGMASLAGQTNHSGIKIKFVASSGTAVTDSCLTGPTGSYSTNISGGLYVISYSKSGFQTATYNNGALTALTNTVSLPSVTLAAGNAVYVSGNVSGTWLTNTTYFVQGNLDVPAGTTLNIPAGTVVAFLGNYSLSVHGAINATGTAASPINFMPVNATQPWATFDLYSGPNTLDYCHFENFVGIGNWNATSNITNNQIFNTLFFGISLVDGQVNIENNDFLNCRLAGIVGAATSGTITCNRISAPLYRTNYNNYNWGLHVNGSELITNNDISECQEGIFIYNVSTNPRVMSNFIHDNNVGMLIEANNSPTIAVSNNVFYNNNYGISNGHTGLTLCNNIIASSTVALMGNGGASIDHNLFFGCGTNFSMSPAVPGLGQVVNNNSNGDPIDSYYNLFIDPNFGNSMPFVQQASPAINAGNSSYGPYIGIPYSTGTCFRPIVLTSLNEQQDKIFFKIYPNPAKGIFSAEISGASRIRIYDFSGKEILNQGAVDGINTVDITGYPAGIYLCLIEGKKGTTSIKLINL